MSAERLVDTRGRALAELRISVTDRCNFRCRYCMPREQFAEASYLPRTELLDFEEIAEVVDAFIQLGVRKVRLTGGEPLLRRDLPELVRLLARPELDLALTTNGVLLPKLAKPLRDAGLSRLTVSLDALDAATFERMTDAGAFGPSDVLAGIAAAERAGFSRIKVNAVVRRAVNDGEVLALARHFRGTGHVLRFIEYMDVGSTNGWRAEDVVTGAELRERLSTLGELLPGDEQELGVARRFRLADGSLELGFVESVSQPFCGDCVRARLSADGKIYTCLFATEGHDLKALLRARVAADASGGGAFGRAPSGDIANEAVRARIRALWSARNDRYSEARAESPAPPVRARLPLAPRVEMSFIGG